MKNILLSIGLFMFLGTQAQTLEEINQVSLGMCEFFETDRSSKTEKELLEEFWQTEIKPYLLQSTNFEHHELYEILETRLFFNCKAFHDLNVSQFKSDSNEDISYVREKSEVSKADVNRFLKQKQFYYEMAFVGKTYFEIADGIWKIRKDKSDNYALYKYKQINDTQFELEFIESNYRENKYLKGDKLVIEILSFDRERNKFKLSKNIKGTSIYEFEYYYYN